VALPKVLCDYRLRRAIRIMNPHNERVHSDEQCQRELVHAANALQIAADRKPGRPRRPALHTSIDEKCAATLVKLNVNHFNHISAVSNVARDLLRTVHAPNYSGRRLRFGQAAIFN
jgi:hypothetical protein